MSLDGDKLLSYVILPSDLVQLVVSLDGDKLLSYVMLPSDCVVSLDGYKLSYII